MVFSISYAGFLLFPLQAPRVALPQFVPDQLDGFFWVKVVTMQIEHGLVQTGGCFPSAHVAAATVLMFASWKLGRAAFIAALTIIAPIYLATVYLHLHYAVDVLAGWLVAGATIVATPARIFRTIAPSPNRTDAGA
jgi:membrane-associated phospholipid phosphatase